MVGAVSCLLKHTHSMYGVIRPNPRWDAGALNVPDAPPPVCQAIEQDLNYDGRVDLIDVIVTARGVMGVRSVKLLLGFDYKISVCSHAATCLSFIVFEYPPERCLQSELANTLF